MKYVPLIILLIAFVPSVSLAAGADIHAVTGAAIAYRLADNDLEAFALGVASHALFDAIPHYDPWPFKKKIGVHELQIGLTMGLLIDRYEASGQDNRLFFGAVGGVIPDLDHFVNKERSKKVFPTHNGTIKHGRQLSRDEGIALNLVLTGLAIAAIDAKTGDAPQLAVKVVF